MNYFPLFPQLKIVKESRHTENEVALPLRFPFLNSGVLKPSIKLFVASQPNVT